MAIGKTPTSGELNNDLVQLIVRWRDVAQDTATLQEQITGLGHAGLVGAGFSDSEATEYVNALSYMSTNAGVFQGTATQADLFDFENQLAKYVVGS